MRSTFGSARFSTVRNVYSRMYSGGNTSSSVMPRLDGHWRFFGGILLAV